MTVRDARLAGLAGDAAAKRRMQEELLPSALALIDRMLAA